ncbi:YciI family protein [Nonomuraea sp. B12E4]|uniref:YciI family protein n=1 Tax=Nonomuraea sp. B12E4 TaxID=3153564 RepID=UPI00325CB4CE
MTRFMLLTKYDDDFGAGPMSEWDPDDMTAHLDHLRRLNQALIDSGELVEMRALAGPDLAKVVASDGRTGPVIAGGPWTGLKEVLAGYQVVDVESEARAIEIAAQVSAAPGPGGVPLRQSIEVRQVMGGVPELEDM